MAKIEALLNLDIGDVQRMSRKELASVVSQLASAANKRLTRLELSETGTLSPAYQQATKRAERFSVAGKNVNQLRNEYKHVAQFLKRSTSSVSGWNKVRKKTHERIGGKFKTAEQEKRFWEAYRKLERGHYSDVMGYGSTETQRMLRREYDTGKSDEEIMEAMMNRLDEEYEAAQTEMREEFDDYDTGDFFTIGEDEDI